jgi:hypothetical protein
MTVDEEDAFQGRFAPLQVENFAAVGPNCKDDSGIFTV